MGNRYGPRVRVVVVSDAAETTVADCLDGIAEQGTDRVDVVVIDLDSPDGGADVAIRHPLPSRVVVTRPGDLDRVIEIASAGAPDDRMVLIGADRRPESGWLDAALDGLGRGAIVQGPDLDRLNMAMDRAVVGHLSLATDDACHLARRAEAAGVEVVLAPGMRVAPARSTEAVGAGLPVTTAPVPAPNRYAGLVSIVVCTRRRPEHLARCLASLAALDDRDHEVVVIDNDDEPAIDPRHLPARARSVHLPLQGLDRARNRGLEEAAGDIVAFVDDDCEVDPHWVTYLRNAFADPSVSAATGRVRPASLGRPSQRWFEAHFSFDRGAKTQRFTPWDRRPWYPVWSGSIGTGCNMAFRRRRLLELGGFDVLLDMGTPVGGGGDLDIYARLIDEGDVIAYEADALVWHHHRSTEAAVSRQFFGYGVAVGALVTKSFLDRPGHRWTAARFFLDRLGVAARLVRQSRSGAHLLPVRLIVIDTIGQLAGPPVYLWARWRAGATGTDPVGR